MNNLFLGLAISLLMVSCGKDVENGYRSDNGELNVSGSKGISKLYQKSEDLILYIKANSSNMVRTALIGGADPNYTSFKGETPLVVAANLGHNEIVQELLRYGAKASQPDENGDYALFKSIEKNHLGIFKALVDTMDNISILNPKKESALILALKKHNQTMANILIKNAINVKLKDSSGKDAIELARVAKLDQTLNLLLDIDRLNGKEPSDDFIMDLIGTKSYETLDYISRFYLLKEKLKGKNALSYIINSNDPIFKVKTLKLFLESKFNPDGHNEDYQIPVITAVKNNDFNSLKTLYKYGAKLNQLDQYNSNALTYAVRKLNEKIIDYLYTNGTQVEFEYEHENRLMLKDNCRVIPRYWRPTSELKQKIKRIKALLDC